MHPPSGGDLAIVGAGQFVRRLVGPLSDQAMEHGHVDRRPPAATALQGGDGPGVPGALDPADPSVDGSKPASCGRLKAGHHEGRGRDRADLPQTDAGAQARWSDRVSVR